MRILGYLLVLFACVTPVLGDGILSERVFIAPTKTDYCPGDTIAIIGKVISTDTISFPYSKYLYVEIFNNKDSVVLRKKLRCNESGYFTAKLSTDILWKADVYYLRAYTRLMQNFKADVYPTIPLQIGKKIVRPELYPSTINCSFFPEGGRLVGNVPQTMTVYLTDANGFPLQLPFDIVVENDTIIRQHTTLSGLQRFVYTPQNAKRFELRVSLKDGQDFTFNLPEPTNGMTIQLSGNSRRLIYKILGVDDSCELPKLYVFHPKLGIHDLHMSSEHVGALDLMDLPSGVLTFFLMHGGEIVSERNYYIERKQNLSIPYLSKTDYKSGDFLDISTGHSDGMHVYVRFYPEDYWCGGHMETWLRETASLISDVRFPIYYYQGNELERRNDMECWLLSSAFGELNLKDLLKEEFNYRYLNERELAISGKVLEPSEKLLKSGGVSVIHTKTGSAYFTSLNEKGEFYVPVHDFMEGDEFFVSASEVGKGKGKRFEFSFSDDVFPPVVNLYPVKKELMLGEAEVDIGMADDSDYGLDKNNLLPELKVKAKIKEKEVSTKKFYATNYIDVEAEDKYSNFASIIADIPSVVLEETKEFHGNGRISKSYCITSVRGQSSINGGEVVILIDGMRIDANEAMKFLPFELSSVEYFSPSDAMKFTYGAINGALVVTTRKFKKQDAIDTESKGVIYVPIGLVNYNCSLQEMQQPIEVPTLAGRYRMLIDIVTMKGEVISSEQIIKVN